MKIEGCHTIAIDKTQYEKPLFFLILWLEAVQEREHKKGYDFYDEIRTDFFNDVLKRTCQLN
jgi:hypothetical protein